MAGLAYKDRKPRRYDGLDTQKDKIDEAMARLNAATRATDRAVYKVMLDALERGYMNRWEVERWLQGRKLSD